MKALLRLLLAGGLVVGPFVTLGIAAPQKYGEEISNRTLTPVKAILADPKAYDGKLVTIEGKIASECQTGCWFNVKVVEGDFVIYVDIGKSGFAIPQYVGKKVLVEGTVVVKKSGPMIQGRGVEIR